jgi:hypothetical protein
MIERRGLVGLIPRQLSASEEMAYHIVFNARNHLSCGEPTESDKDAIELLYLATREIFR